MISLKKSVIICLFLVFVLTLAVGAEDNIKILMSGMEHYFQGDYEQALSKLDIDIEDENIKNELKVNILYYRTLSQIKLYKIIEAKNVMEKLSDIGYEFGYLYRKLGEVYLNKEGQFDYPFYNEARKNLIKAEKLGINSVALHSDLAVSYQGLGETEKAIKEYEYILGKGKNDVNFLNLAELYKEKGYNQEAIKYYKEVLTDDSKNISVYVNLGDLYLKNNEYNNAIDILEEGVKLDNSFAAMYYKLAHAYYLNGDYEQAKAKFEQVISKNENYYQAYYYLGEIYKNKENWQHALYNYEQAVKYNPDFADAYIAMGNIYLKQENYYKAISSFSSAIEKNENYPEGHYRLGITYYRLNMKEAAIKELRTTLHLSSEYKQAEELLNKLTEE